MIDTSRLQSTLLDLLAIPSPCGFTDEVVHYISRVLSDTGIEHELTRRGMIRAYLKGRSSSPARAIVTHVDTIGAMVRQVRDDGRILVAPIGHWSSRFAEGARVTIFADQAAYKGCLLPMVKWGESHDNGVSAAPQDWEHIELRVEEAVYSAGDVEELGIEPGNFIAVDSEPQVFENGYIVGRSLDNKAGSAAVLETMRHLVEEDVTPSHDIDFLFTISETIGRGMGGAILPEVSELVTVDFACVKTGEKSPFKQVTLATSDASGPYDFHLTAHLRKIARSAEIPLRQRHLRAFHSDAAAALVSGADVRTAVLAYAGDASHSVERTHVESLKNIARLLEAYIVSEPTFPHDDPLTTVDEFSHQIQSEQLPCPPAVPDTASVIRHAAGKQSDTDAEK